MSNLFEIKIDDHAVLEALNRITNAATHTSPAMRRIAGVMMDETEEAFEREADPATGDPWPQLRPSTIRNRQRKGKWPGKMLQVTGLLAASVSSQSGDGFARVGSNLRYALIHQLGGAIAVAARSQKLHFRQNARTGEVGRRFVREHKSNFAQWATVGAHEIHIPPRPFLGISPEGNRKVLTILSEYLLASV
ncbi:MAG: phage virion morphogenesis protein [Magnetococcus sp. YQC-5]